MNATLEHRCSACGHLVGTTKRKRATIGRPFDECPSCGAFVARPPYDEWGLMAPAARLELVAAGVSLALAIGLLPAVLFGLGSLVGMARPEVGELIVLGGAGVVLALGAWGLGLARSLERSRRRVSDPWYKAKLVKFGMQARADGWESETRAASREGTPS